MEFDIILNNEDACDPHVADLMDKLNHTRPS
jgi:hypothetical protein